MLSKTTQTPVRHLQNICEVQDKRSSPKRCAIQRCCSNSKLQPDIITASLKHFIMERTQSLRLVFCLLLLIQCTFSQTTEKKRSTKKDSTNAAIEELKKQIEDIVNDLNLLKEQQSLQSMCLRGTKVPGKCLLADPVKKNFHAASDDCVAKGGSLSTPLRGDENDQLYAYVRQSISPEESIWLGINDMVTEGQWLDQSGSSLRFKNWETEITMQPDGGRSQNCGVLATTANGKWFDESCRGEKASVCEFNIV
ncbi:tetranectin [Syngnathus acus]|uniref:tetranectin n=1 Tax=Syngnathus acus TaxID=161584 RepID=UPI00188647D0|nr:tetranectin [Syngnathus acus]